MQSNVVLCCVLVATATHLGAAVLRVERPQIEVMSRPEIARKCGGPDRLACTAIATNLISSCSATGQVWQPRSFVRVAPQVYTSSPAVLAHEFLHVADVAAALRHRAEAIEAHQFESEESCMAFLAHTEESMGRVFLEIEQDSDRKRDPRTAFAPATPLAASLTEPGIALPND